MQRAFSTCSKGRKACSETKNVFRSLRESFLESVLLSILFINKTSIIRAKERKASSTTIGRTQYSIINRLMKVKEFPNLEIRKEREKRREGSFSSSSLRSQQSTIKQDRKITNRNKYQPQKGI